MSTSKDTVAFIEDQLAGLPIRTNPMFGEYGMYYDDKVVGFICDDTLFIKPSEVDPAVLDRHGDGARLSGLEALPLGARRAARGRRLAPEGDPGDGRRAAGAEAEEAEGAPEASTRRAIETPGERQLSWFASTQARYSSVTVPVT